MIHLSMHLIHLNPHRPSISTPHAPWSSLSAYYVCMSCTLDGGMQLPMSELEVVPTRVPCREAYSISPLYCLGTLLYRAAMSYPLCFPCFTFHACTHTRYHKIHLALNNIAFGPHRLYLILLQTPKPSSPRMARLASNYPIT